MNFHRGNKTKLLLCTFRNTNKVSIIIIIIIIIINIIINIILNLYRAVFMNIFNYALHKKLIKDGISNLNLQSQNSSLKASFNKRVFYF